MPDRFSTGVPDLFIRYAQRDDAAVLLSLIRELAAFEKLLDHVEADEATLTEELFGGPRVAEALIAELGGEPVGFALFFHNFSTFV
ncbi:MAG: family N-acetyltransferase, partial [Betaproteobacteria bacterium]|nr:family N-acetyltransferase [Betaproteobacteria bacterium]